jgi:hypothetical protein
MKWCPGTLDKVKNNHARCSTPKYLSLQDWRHIAVADDLLYFGPFALPGTAD